VLLETTDHISQGLYKDPEQIPETVEQDQDVLAVAVRKEQRADSESAVDQGQ
jgi:hypothetical protein